MEVDGACTPAVGVISGQWLRTLRHSDNVWEWCADWWDRNYYSGSPAKESVGVVKVV